MTQQAEKKGGTGLIVGIAIPVVGLAIYGGWKLKEFTNTSDREFSGDKVYSVGEAAKIDPALIAWKQVEEIQTGLKMIDSFARAGDTHVVAVGGRKLAILSRKSGKPPTIVALQANAKAVAVADGRVYIGERDHIEIVDLEGVIIEHWPSLGQGALITSLAVSGEHVWVGDAGQRIVHKLDMDGKVVGKIGQRDEAKGFSGLIMPSPHLDVVPMGNLLWLNNPGKHEIQGFDVAGNLVKQWGKAGMKIEGFSGCCNPTDFAIFPDGKFVTTEKGVPRVKVYSADGKFENVVAGPETFGEEASGMDVAVDAAGRVWVADVKRGSIRVFEKKS